MVRGEDHVCVAIEPLLLQRVQQPGEVVVRVLDCRERRRAVDARDKPPEAVALVVLRPVRVAGPEHDDEWLLAFLEQRKHRFRRHIGEVVLLLHVGDCRPGDRAGAGLAVVAACRGLRRQSDRGQALLQFVRQRNAAWAAGHVIDHDGVLPAALGVIEYEGRAELADAGGRETGLAGRLEDGLLVQVVASEVLIDIAQHRIALQERGQAVARTWDLEAGVNVVAEIAGIAEQVPRRHAGCIRRGECREQRVGVGEPDAARQERGHRGRGSLIDHSGPQAVGDEQDNVAGAGLGGGRSGQDPHCGRDEQRTHPTIPLAEQSHGLPRNIRGK